MKITPLSEDSIAYVIDHISAVDLEEMDRLGEALYGLHQMFKSMIGRPFTGVFCDDEGRYCSLLALEPVGSFRWRAHMISVDGSFGRIGRSMTRFLARMARQFTADTRGSIEILSPPICERISSWLEAMGFRAQRQDNGLILYVCGR